MLPNASACHRSHRQFRDRGQDDSPYVSAYGTGQRTSAAGAAGSRTASARAAQSSSQMIAWYPPGPSSSPFRCPRSRAALSDADASFVRRRWPIPASAPRLRSPSIVIASNAATRCCAHQRFSGTSFPSRDRPLRCRGRRIEVGTYPWLLLFQLMLATSPSSIVLRRLPTSG